MITNRIIGRQVRLYHAQEAQAALVGLYHDRQQE